MTILVTDGRADEPIHVSCVLSEQLWTLLCIFPFVCAIYNYCILTLQMCLKFLISSKYDEKNLIIAFWDGADGRFM